MSKSAMYGAGFLERISATTIVNQAVIKCSIAGVPVTQENVILFVGDFADPSEPDHAGLITQIEQTIEDIFSAATGIEYAALN
jgi:hypothetical protein